MQKYILLLLILTVAVFANANDKKAVAEVQNLPKPLYNPFVENYILHEIKQLRDENRDLKVDLHKTLAKKEVEISNNAISYATSTINNMFYILAAATSLLVIVGWSSIRDINTKIESIIDSKVSAVINEYELRMHTIEKDLEKRSRQVFQNQKDIEETNTIHSLWMRASQETTLNGKIEIYDEILRIRVDDIEAIIYKADAVLDLGEAHWALNLANQAIEIKDSYASAFYQRAKVYSVLGFIDNALEDLEKAIKLNEQYIFEVKNEAEFEEIIKHEKFIELLQSLEMEQNPLK
jgi:tetratricopeptide (TPR) repeat protein